MTHPLRGRAWPPAARRSLLFATAVAGYAVAAMAVSPGFFDGMAPNQAYRWLVAPSELPSAATGPAPAHARIPALSGSIPPGSAVTRDGQAQVVFDRDRFSAASGAVVIDIKPVTGAPAPSGFSPLSNVYLVTADVQPSQPVSVVLTYDRDFGANPIGIYRADPSGAGGWQASAPSPTNNSAAVATSTTQLGYFVVGGPVRGSGSPGAAPGGFDLPILPVAVAGAALLVVLAGVPLLALRRRGRRQVPERTRAGRRASRARSTGGRGAGRQSVPPAGSEPPPGTEESPDDPGGSRTGSGPKPRPGRPGSGRRPSRRS